MSTQGFLDVSEVDSPAPDTEPGVADILAAVRANISRRPESIRFGSIPVAPGQSVKILGVDPSRYRAGVAVASLPGQTTQQSVFLSDRAIDPNTLNGVRFGEAIQVPSLSGGQSYLITETTHDLFVAVPPAVAVRHNGVPNPAMLNDINGYVPSPGTSGANTLSRLTGAGGPTGGPYLRATWTAASTAISGGIDMAGGAAGTLTNVAVGQPYSAGVWARVNSNQRLQLLLIGAGVSYVSATAPVVDVQANYWTYLTFSTATVFSAGTPELRVLAAGGGYGRNWAIGDTLDADLFIGEQTANGVGTYFDGSSAGASWDGTAGESSSTLYNASPALVSFFSESYSAA